MSMRILPWRVFIPIVGSGLGVFVAHHDGPTALVFGAAGVGSALASAYYMGLESRD